MISYNKNNNRALLRWQTFNEKKVVQLAVIMR